MSEHGSNELESGLIRRVQDGDIGAFDALFEKYRRGILAYVFGMCGDRELAEDIVQECFVELVRRIRKIDPGRGAGGWLYRVARNRTVDCLRHRKFEILPGDEALAEQRETAGHAPVRTAAEEVIARESARGVRRALMELSRKERDVLALRFYGGLKFNEIAQVLGRPLGTVLWQARRSLGKLKDILDEM